MKRIMFVCHGNICRSPMAEFIFKAMLRENGINDVTVCSSATSTEEIRNGVGNPVYPPAREELKKHGISCDGKRAVQLQKSDYECFDIFLCMDSANVRNTLKIFGSDPQRKVKRLMELTDRPSDVADPWYSNRFDIAYADIYEGCSALYKKMYN